MTESTVRTTRYDREPVAHVSYVDPKSRLFCHELPASLVQSISCSFDEVKSRSGPFPDDWLMDAMQFALTLRDDDELFEHPDCFEDKVMPEDAIRLVIEAATSEFNAHGVKMSPHYASLILADIQRKVLRKMLANAPK